MRKCSNDCGSRNSFGYYDARSKEIILKRPCFNKKDIDEVYVWLDDAADLCKFSVGIGAVENTVIDDNGDNLYAAARGVIRQNVMQTVSIDNDILKNMLPRLKNLTKLQNFALKCYLFSEDQIMFEMLLQTIKSLKSLIYLDLSGCYFTDEQLIDLADVVSRLKIAHLIWPEPRMSELVMRKVAEKLKENRALVIMQGVPLDFAKIAQDNRQWLFNLGRRPTLIGVKEAELIKEYASSLRLGIAYEKQRLFDLEKSIEAVLV